jgi:catechol O-methyltransferase
MARLTEIGGRRLPIFRWSFVRMMLGMRRLSTEWQVGDGREEALAEYVTSKAVPGDLDSAIATVDEFAYHRSFMINVGDEKGALLDAAVRRAEPQRLLELGTYCGYSALRTARVMPEDAHLYSIEFLEANADIARRILSHAGVDSRVTVVVGSLGDEGKTMAALEHEHGFTTGSLGFVFIDHAKDAYLPDLERIQEHGWLRPGAIVVADNVKLPGAPDYRDYMREQEGSRWRTTEHETHVEYQSLLKDLVLESEYVGEEQPA